MSISKLLLLTTFVGVFNFSSFSQDRAIRESIRKMSEGENNSLSITLEKFSRREALQTWTRYLQRFRGKTTVRKYLGEIFTDNASIPDISANVIDIYSMVNEKDDGSELIVWFYLGGKYLSRTDHGDKYHVAADLLYDYSDRLALDVAIVNVKRQQDSLKMSTRTLKKIKKNEIKTNIEIAKLEDKLRQKKQSLDVDRLQTTVHQQAIPRQEEALAKAKKQVEVMRGQ